MKGLIRLAIDRPVAVAAAVILLVMFGAVGLARIPVQLAPDVSKPVVTVNTAWPGAAPKDVEREILIRQEDVIRGIQGLDDITGRAQTGKSELELEFRVGTDMSRALLMVSNRLDRVTDYPDGVDEPDLDTSGANASPMAWFVFTRAPGNDRPVHTFGDFVEDEVQERVERVPGVSTVNLFGTSERQLEVVFKPDAMARHNLTVPEVRDTLRAANVSTSAGDVTEGKRRYVVRTEGELDAVEKVQEIVLRSDDATGDAAVGRLTVGDVADVQFGTKKPTERIRFNGEPALAMNAVRQTGANVITTMEGIQAEVDRLNQDLIPRVGLELTQVYDQTVYIHSAIGLVQQNIYVGGLFAALILLVFLRSIRATLVVSLAIPVSIVGAFVAMAALGRSINVISLAGFAFAIGMVVDSAIVVLENIYRLREQGYRPRDAAYEGARQVWGAVLVSALTTVVVFAPILMMELEVGQLFRDIGVAISTSVVLALIVAVTVIPTLARRLLRFRGSGDEPGGFGEVKRITLPGIDHAARGFVGVIMGAQRLFARSRAVSAGVVVAVTVAALAGSWLALPKLAYLPEGNRNLVLAVLIPPPGYNLDTTFDMASEIEGATRNLWRTVTGPEAEPGGPPKIDRFFFVATRAQTFVGAAAVQRERVSELIPVLRGPVFAEPGAFGFISQPSIFGDEIGGGRQIELDIIGPDLEGNMEVARRAAQRIGETLPRDEGNQLRPNPGLELGSPELRVHPDRVRLSDAGMTAQGLADSVTAFNDNNGLLVQEVTVDTTRMDLMLRGERNSVKQTQGLRDLPVLTPPGEILPVAALGDVRHTAGPTEVRHRERQRAVTLQIRPRPLLPLESAVERVREDVIAPLEREGLPAGVRLEITGTADKLTQTWNAMVWDLALALAIVYLTMAVLFESFLYPVIMLLSVPVAAAGGVAGLGTLNLFTFQPLDMLTLLGFVILIGIVVNNAILLVHQTLHLIREDGLVPSEAIVQATRNRIRPIFMSTLTSVFGMLPLVLFPGAGSELYRGLGSVVVGGLSLSAIITLLIVPPMMTLVLEPVERRAQARGAYTHLGAAPSAGEAAPSAGE